MRSRNDTFQLHTLIIKKKMEDNTNNTSLFFFKNRPYVVIRLIFHTYLEDLKKTANLYFKSLFLKTNVLTNQNLSNAETHLEQFITVVSIK